MSLSGGVALENDFGKVSANEIILHPAESGSKMKFSSLELNGDVVFTIKENGTIECESAKMDLIKKQGAFLAKNADEFVSYTELVKGNVPISLQGRRMLFELEGEYSMKLIRVEQDVTISYKENLLVSGDLGIYDCKEHTFTLIPQGEGRVCNISDPEGGFSLVCPGEIKVDKQNQQIILKSEDEQIFYSDGLGKAYANQMILEYNTSTEPQKLTLLGNVRILNREGVLTQYVLADRAEYLFDQFQMSFSAEKGNRVILYDRPNNLEVSAPGLKITRNPETKKDSIQGFGDVRFELVEEEIELLKKRFLIERNQIE